MEFRTLICFLHGASKSCVGRVVPYEGNFEFSRKMYVVGFNVSTAANI